MKFAYLGVLPRFWASRVRRSAAVYDATEREQRAARIALEWVQAFDLPSVADLVPCANRVYARLQELERLWRCPADSQAQWNCAFASLCCLAI